MASLLIREEAVGDLVPKDVLLALPTSASEEGALRRVVERDTVAAPPWSRVRLRTQRHLAGAPRLEPRSRRGLPGRAAP